MNCATPGILPRHTFTRQTRAIAVALPILLISFGSILSTAHAQQIYKSVDENGVVSYSTIPPTGNQPVESLDAIPEPSAADVQAAQQRLQSIRQSTEQIRQRRQDRLAAELEAAQEDEDESGGTGAPPGNSSNPIPKLAPLPSVGGFGVVTLSR